MTDLLKRAVAEAEQLPQEDQDLIAHRMLEEIASERRWAELIADPRSHALLECLAAEAIAEHEAGETRDLDELLGQA
jgi:hypothetical protein